MKTALTIAACAVVFCLSPAAPSRVAAGALDPVSAWGQAASVEAAASGMAPLRTPITLALLHVAMFDAVTAIEGERRPDAVGARPRDEASAYAAAVSAGYRILLAELPARAERLARTYDRLLAAEPDSDRRRRGIEVGAEVARKLLARREGDGRNAIVAHEPATRAGLWIPTPPRFLAATTAFLAKVTPFTMRTPWQFRPSGPPRLGSRKWAEDYNEVARLGRRESSTRTPAQTATALFWEPSSSTVWFETIPRLAREQSLDLGASARFQAAAFAAFADGLIACWDAKFRFNSWRPVSAIQHGDSDGNPGTEADPSWEPLAVTPNFPEYPSGHACTSAAVAHTIEAFFPEGVVIPVRNVVSGEERFYNRPADLVAEIVEARMLLGLHFRAGDEDGAQIGRDIARQIAQTWLREGLSSRAAIAER